MTSCAGPSIYTPNALVDMILKPRPGHEGKLTNRSCFEYEGEKCLREQVTEFEINDMALHERLNSLGFICNIAGKRYKLCKDKTGFCRFKSEKKCFLGICRRTEKQEEYLPEKPYQYLLDAKARCFNYQTYPFEGVGQ